MIGGMMFMRRYNAIRNKTVKMSHFKSYVDAGPEELEVIKNNYSNQFELPVLFFITILASVALNTTRPVTVILAVVFLISRFVHFRVHTGSNDIRKRALWFFMGFVIVIAMWIQIIGQATLPGPI
jgi:hypothetical protein